MKNILIAGLSCIALAGVAGSASAQTGTTGQGTMGSGSTSGTMTRDRAGTTGSTGTMMDQAPASSPSSGVDRPSNSGGPAVGAPGVNPRTNNQTR